MKGMWAVLTRELAEWRLLFLVAFVAGLLPLAVPWLPSPGGLEPADIRDGMALGLAVLAGAVLAVLLGSSVLARDLSERRLGFYFVRPLSGAAIWAGKMLGAVILVFGCSFLVLLPGWLARGTLAPAGSSLLPVSGTLVAVLQLIVGMLLLLVAAHAVSVMVRSRSPWLVLDLAGLAAVVAAVWSCRGFLRSEGALGAAEMMLTAVIGGALVAAAVAGLVQVVRGRTDLRRGHRILSLTLWSTLGVVALAGVAYTRWVLAATPRDLVDFQVLLPAPSGSWIAVSGPVAWRFGYRPAFLLDLASGRFVKIHGEPEPYRLRTPMFTEDGSRALWLAWSKGEGYVLSALDLRRPGAVPVRTGVSYQDRPLMLAVTPDGARLATLWRDRVTVDDLRKGRMLVSQKLPDDSNFDLRLRFDGPDRLRVYQSSENQMVWRLTTLDLDIATRRITPGPAVETTGRNWSFDLSPDGDRALLDRYPARETELADLRTGRTRRLPTPQEQPYMTTFLADGRLILAEVGRQKINLRLLAPDGTEQRSMSLPGFHLRIGGQPAPDLLAVATAPGVSRSVADYEQWTSWLVDLRTGKVRVIERGLLPTTINPRQPGSLASRLFYRGRGDLHALDPATGKLQTLLPGGREDSSSPPYPWYPLIVQNYRWMNLDKR